MKIRRVILNPGHGMNNATMGVYDPGAVADGFEEAQIVRGVCNAAAVMSLSPPRRFEITPHGLSLREVILWVNTRYREGDLILSVHMNAGGGTGVEVLHSATARQERARQAAAMSAAAAKRLGIKDRGAKSDHESHRGKLAILANTKAPALLIELGFIDNPADRAKVMANGAAAVIDGLQVIL